MAYELNQRKNICIFGNAIASQIILRTKFREFIPPNFFLELFVMLLFKFDELFKPKIKNG